MSAMPCGPSNPLTTVLVVLTVGLLLGGIVVSRRDRRVARFTFPDVTLNLPDDATVGFTASGHPYIGDVAQSPIKLELFCDLQCPYCRYFYSYALGPLMEGTNALQTDVSLTFYDFPLPFHPAALPAALASRCAGVVAGAKSYWSMQLTIFSRKNLYEVKEDELKDVFAEYAGDVLKDDETLIEKYKACYSEQTPLENIKKDLAFSAQRGVRGTPTLFVNGQISSARTLKELQLDISAARKNSTASSGGKE